MTREPTARRPTTVLGFALTIVRTAQGWKQFELAEAIGTTRSVVSGWERGSRPLSRESLAAYAERMGFDVEDLDFALFIAEWVLARRPGLGADDPEAADRRAIGRAAGRMVRLAVETVRLELDRAVKDERARRERAEAAALWQEVQGVPPRGLRAIVQGAREYQTRAFCELVCRESERAAADDAERAVALAEVALRVAERVPGGEARRRRTAGYAWAHVGNARRVANDHAGADAAFATAQALWKAGAPEDDGFLDPALPLDLEASLRRAERRFAEALRLHGYALAVASPRSAAYVLLNKAFTYEQAGRCDRAVATLREAASRIDGEREPRQLFALRFNLATNLCHLDRHAEAAALVPEVRRMAVDSGNELDLVRVLWLDARVLAGLGRYEEAVAALEQVCRDFAARALAYDMALASLDLAVLYLEEGRSGDVRVLARQMVAVFAARQVHREALAALVLFERAAEAETATAGLARRLAVYLEHARRQPGLRFEG